ncbi:MAG: ATP synthase F0 subunit C [Clostridia bacterium]|nr:ATP synthase F0 subunit C [Clostridia bacterium]
MKKVLKTLFLTLFILSVTAVPVFAEGAESSVVSVKAIAAAIIMAVAATAGAIAMAIAIAKAEDSTARQPEAAGNIRTAMMMGLVFIETAIIYALITAIIIIFVL